MMILSTDDKHINKFTHKIEQLFPVEKFKLTFDYNGGVYQRLSQDMQGQYKGVIHTSS